MPTTDQRGLRCRTAGCQHRRHHLVRIPRNGEPKNYNKENKKENNNEVGTTQKRKI